MDKGGGVYQETPPSNQIHSSFLPPSVCCALSVLQRTTAPLIPNEHTPDDTKLRLAAAPEEEEKHCLPQDTPLPSLDTGAGPSPDPQSPQ